jgi:antitoxin component YwqK of YwqJK toxin-antitoxin module
MDMVLYIGLIKAKGYYKEGEAHGIWTYYHENGEIITNRRSKKKKKNTDYVKYFNENGQLIHERYLYTE